MLEAISGEDPLIIVGKGDSHVLGYLLDAVKRRVEGRAFQIFHDVALLYINP
jgi:hypothetical protein